MEQEVQDQLSGSINPEAVLGLIGGKAKRNSQKKAAKIVKNSVPASKRKTKITNEQGFRNYLQYTDPLLLKNNEVDKSDIATSLANLLNVFAPNKMETQKLKEVQGYIVREEPADSNDIANEIQNKSATKIQKIVKGRNVKSNVNVQKGLLSNGSYLETGSGEYPIVVGYSHKKAKRAAAAAAGPITRSQSGRKLDFGNMDEYLNLLNPSEKNPRELQTDQNERKPKREKKPKRDKKPKKTEK